MFSKSIKLTSTVDLIPHFIKTNATLVFNCIYKNVGILLGEGCLTCEELVGVTHTGKIICSPE